MSESSPIKHPTWLTSGDFTEADEPLRLFAAWFEEAKASEPRDPTAMSLATVDADGLPNVRMVLMKGFDERGFVFYTNVDSAKGRELDASRQGALLFHWKSLNRQVRLRGPVERVTEAEADAYFATRPRLAQIGAWASKQSTPLASRGIGHATVKRFSAAGWRVITCSRHAFPENCPWEMGPEDHIQVDLADPARTSDAIAEIKQRLEHGELHALVNNAAISPKADGGTRLSSIDTTVDVWDHVFRVNFFAPIMLARGLLEQLKAAKGSVVNVTSIDGSRVHPFAGAPYATSTAALAALTREMAADFGPLGIRVNAIAPGEIDTIILSPGTSEIVAHHIPIHRTGAHDE